jgi:hypothetical protein
MKALYHYKNWNKTAVSFEFKKGLKVKYIEMNRNESAVYLRILGLILILSENQIELI